MRIPWIFFVLNFRFFLTNPELDSKMDEKLKSGLHRLTLQVQALASIQEKKWKLYRDSLNDQINLILLRDSINFEEVTSAY